MLKRIVTFILLFISLSVNAIHVSDNVNIRVETDFLSKYVYRGSCLSYENFQTSARFMFGKDSTIGTFNVQPFFTIGHGIDDKFYYEIDAIASYTTPGNYLSVGCRYLNYDGLLGREHELQVGFIGTLADIFPMTLVAETTVFNDNFLFDTHVVLTYDGIYKMWEFIPTVGFRFGCFDPYGYLQFDAKRNVELSEKTKLFVKFSGNVNSIDIMTDFTYQKNINGWISFGFIF